MHSFLFLRNQSAQSEARHRNANKWAAVGGKKTRLRLSIAAVPNASNAALSSVEVMEWNASLEALPGSGLGRYHAQARPDRSAADVIWHRV